MNALRKIAQQFATIWNQAGAAQRAALGTAAVLLLLATIGVGVWSSRPQYVQLASGLDPNEAAELASLLEAKSIDYKMSFAGSAVMVSSSDYKNARLAAGGALDPSSSPLDPVGGSFMEDSSLNTHRIDLRLEQALRRTIINFDAVKDATVHIGKPPASPFLNEQHDVTASVVLTMKHNAAFSARQAAAIVATVSRAVEGLRPENVIVTDTQGRILADRNQSGGDIASQLEYKQRVEADLSSNAELMLSQMLGFGKAIIRVTADIDFTRSSRKETIYDPDGKVRTMEKIMTKETQDGSVRSGGVPGMTANTRGGGAIGIGKGETTSKDETIESTFEVGKTEDMVTEAAGKIKRLTVAAVVDLSALETEGEPSTVTPEQIEGIIKQAVGFDVARNDEIEVVVSSLASAPIAVEPLPVNPLTGYETLIKHASLAIAALVALVVSVLILRKVQPGIAPAQGGLDAKHARALATMSDSMRQDPTQLREALKLWLEDESESTEAARAA